MTVVGDEDDDNDYYYLQLQVLISSNITGDMPCPLPKKTLRENKE